MIELAINCTPLVDPHTVIEVIRVESNGDPLAMNVNGISISGDKPKTALEAANLTRSYIENGYSVDIGLMQINSNNLSWLGISPEQIDVLFTPCANINAGSRILSEAYQRAVKKFEPGQEALQAALSEYNTGNFVSGFENGYVYRYIESLPAEGGLATSILNTDTGIVWVPPEGYFGQSSNEIKEDTIMNSPNEDKKQLDDLDALDQKLTLMSNTPGLVIEMDPEDADKLGAFEEDALSLEDALDSSE